jgi:tRNA-splicing ligase RtcB
MSALPQHVHVWSASPLERDVIHRVERIATADDVQHVAIMPDVHIAEDVCVGVVAATSDRIYPAAVGQDIGCGMAAIRLCARAKLLASERSAGRVLAGLYQAVPGLKMLSGRIPSALPESLASRSLSTDRLNTIATRDGRVQFGTLGRGNHFVEIQTDETDALWLMIHSGARAMGRAITEHHRAIAQTLAGANKGLLSLSGTSEEGLAYLHDVEWARLYAVENRLAMIRAIGSLFLDEFNVEMDWDTLIHADHNHVQAKTHFGASYWVHRKGAQAASEGEDGVIPGSMGTASFHVEGRGCPESLASSSHGAGRVLSRSDARRAIKPKRLHQQMDGIWFDHRIAPALCEEAPGAYKDIR